MINERYVLVFDFETTGLPKESWKNYEIVKTYDTRKGIFMEPSNETDFPYAVQLCYILYDNVLNKEKIFNEIIRLPDGVGITPESESIHKISLEITQGKNRKVKNIRTGKYRKQFHLTIEEVLKRFMKDFRKADIIVAHNIQFDKNMLLVEMDRLRKRPEKKYNIFQEYIQEIYHSDKEFCTARNGANICKILAVNKFGKEYYKIPKLSVLYQYLFGKFPNDEKLHNALYDVVICLACFYKIRYDVNVREYNLKINNLLKEID